MALIEWYKYLFTFDKYLTKKEKFINLICRIKGHPNGPVYYTGPHGTEPDMSCVDCGDQL